MRACEEEKFLEGARGEDRPPHVVKKRKGRRQRSAVGVPQKRSFLLPPIFGCCGKSWISSSSSSSSSSGFDGRRRGRGRVGIFLLHQKTRVQAVDR